MTKAIPDDFPLLRPSTPGRRQDRFDDAIETMRRAVADGTIRNSDYQDVKRILGDSASDAMNRHVSQPFFHAGKWEGQPKELVDLYWSISVSTLHDCLSAAKKIDRSGLEGPVMDMMRAVMAEALPLAEASRDLKASVVKGRAPRAEPAPVNPDKRVATCSCCFRGVAVVGATMAHHGYQRPGHGTQTASCVGIRFGPLEDTLEGLEWLIGETETRIEKLEGSLARSGDMTEVSWLEQKGRRGPVERKTCRKGESEWPRRFGDYVRGLEADLRQTTASLGFLAEQLGQWRKVHGLEDISEPSPEP